VSAYNDSSYSFTGKKKKGDDDEDDDDVIITSVS
jgi:hypothetical protein